MYNIGGGPRSAAAKSGKTHSRGREAPRQHTQMWQINQQSLPCAGACCPFAGFIYVTPSAGRKACRKRQLSGGGRGVLGKLSNFRKCNQPATSSGSHSLCSVPRILSIVSTIIATSSENLFIVGTCGAWIHMWKWEFLRRQNLTGNPECISNYLPSNG